MNEGWVKLHRGLLKWEWYDDVNTRVLFMHLLIVVNFVDGKWHGKTIKRGEIITSLSKLAKSSGLSIQNLRTALDHLKSTQEVTQMTSRDYTHLSINNYNKYQEVTQEVTNHQQGANKELTTIEEWKEEKERKEDNTYIRLSPKQKQKIADEFRVSIKVVESTLDDIQGYCRSTGRKYANYLETLRVWIKRDIKTGKIKKDFPVNKTELPPVNQEGLIRYKNMLKEKGLL